MKANRLVLVAAALAVLVLASAAGCGRKEVKPTLIVSSFGGRWEQAQRELVVQPFADKFRADVRVALPGISANVLAHLRAEKGRPSMDVALIGGGLERVAANEGLMEQLDEANIPSLKDLHPAALECMGFGPSIAFSGVGIAYNKEKITSPPTSWLDFWKPEYAGHIGIMNLDSNFGAAHFAIVNQLVGGTNDNIEPALQKFKELMVTHQPLLLRTVDDANTALTQRDAWLVVTTTSGPITLARGGFPVGFVYPDEGGVAWGNYLGVPLGSTQKELGEKFINFFLDPKVQGEWCAQVGYTPTNLKAELPPDFEFVEWLSIPENLLLLDLDWVNANRAAWLERWNTQVLPLLGK